MKLRSVLLYLIVAVAVDIVGGAVGHTMDKGFGFSPFMIGFTTTTLGAIGNTAFGTAIILLFKGGPIVSHPTSRKVGMGKFLIGLLALCLIGGAIGYTMSEGLKQSPFVVGLLTTMVGIVANIAFGKYLETSPKHGPTPAA